ncbi:hypothetical protein IAU60_001991 [Kwoniella sp. DSM 27419]
MDEEADLALLDQHLLKTNLLSQRMTNILGQLDTRLSRLDKTIAPLGLQPLTRKDANIDAIMLTLEGKPASQPSQLTINTSTPAIRSIRSPGASGGGGPSSPLFNLGSPISATSTTAKGYSLDPPAQSPAPIPAPAVSRLRAEPSHLSPIQSAVPSPTASPADETALIMRGPDIMSLREYLNALDGVVGDLERMWKGLMEGRGGAREAGVKDLSKLVEIGFQGLTNLFLEISKEGMGKTIDVEGLLSSGVPTPPSYFSPSNILLPLTTKISSMLDPPLNVSTPKTASIIEPMWSDTLRSFGDMRGDWICRSLNGMIGRVEEIDEGGIWQGGRSKDKIKGLVGLWDSLLLVAEAETLLITTLFPSRPPPSLILSTLSSPLNLLNSTLQPTLNTIKRSLSSQAFVALDLYSSLIRLAGRWDQGMSKCLSMTHTPSSPEAKEVVSVLNQPISTLRGLSLRSFPELLVDIRTTATNGSPTSGINETTYSTLSYLESLPEYEKTVEGLLGNSHSERSWLMGMKEAPSPARSAGEEGGTVKLYVADVLGTLLIYLEAKSRTMRKPIGQAFLLNNLSHIRNTTASFNSDIIGPGAEDMLNKAFRDAKGHYLSEFHSLVALLTASHSTPRFGVPVPSGERSHLKEAAQQFFDRLSELESIVMQYPLNRQDPDMRDRVGRDVEGIVRGGYEAFWARCAGKGVEKYLRGSPDDITRRVQAMFR